MDNNWVGGGAEIVDILFYCIRLQIFFFKKHVCMYVDILWWRYSVEELGRSPGGGHLGIFWVYKKLIPCSGNVPIFYTPF